MCGYYKIGAAVRVSASRCDFFEGIDDKTANESRDDGETSLQRQHTKIVQ